MTARQPVVHLVDDDAPFLKALSRFLRATGLAVECYHSASEFLMRRDGDATGCVVIDLRMPGSSGLELQAALASTPNPLPVVFLSAHGDVRSTVMAMKQGAEDFLTKSSPREELLAAIERAIERNAQDRRRRARKRDIEARVESLTPREREVFSLVVRGKLNKQIAADLGIHERTVKFHRTAITTKLGVPSVAELTRLAQEAGILP